MATGLWSGSTSLSSGGGLWRGFVGLSEGGGLSPGSDGALVWNITMPANVWAFGASSMAGGYIATVNIPTIGTEDTLTNVVRVIDNLPAASLGYTVSSNGGDRTARSPDPITYNLAAPNAAFKINNRGVGGATSGPAPATIVTLMTEAEPSFGASDFMILHQGDNGLSFPGTNLVETLSSGFSQMRALAGARTFVQITNFASSRGSTGSLPGEPPGGAHEIARAGALRVQQKLNPGRAFSFAETLRDRATGLDTADASDVAVGMSPRSYCMDNGSHMIGKGNNLISDVVMTPLIDAWAGGIPFPLKQVVEAVTPATPAAGDVIGNIVSYGAGGTFSLDSSNTQTDYAISASGQITRIGATPPTRDITWMAVQATKAGRAFISSPGASRVTKKVQPLIGIAERAASGVSKLIEFDGFSVMGMPDSKLADGPILTLLMRIQHFDVTQDQTYVCGANGGSGWSVGLRNSGVVEVRFRNAAFIAVNAMSKDTTGTLFSVANAPNGRWLAISIDLSSAIPGDRRTDLVHWVDPASPIQDIAVLNGTNQPANAGTVSININRSSPWYIGARVPPPTVTTQFVKTRWGDLTWFNSYIDFSDRTGVGLTNRQEISNSNGTPKTAWVASGGVTAGVTPYGRLAGNSSDVRLCNITGTGAPATPGDTGQYIAFNNRERSAGVPGFLVTV